MDTPKIYVACLAAYNNGHLHGTWIELSKDIDEVWKEIKEMLKTSPIPEAEEYAIHDYEGFSNLHLSEYECIERVHELAEFIEENGELGAGLIDHFCGDLEEAKRARQNYYGEYASLADYAIQLTEETSEVPQHLEFYIDYEAIARDIEMSGDVFTIQTAHDEIHVFSNY